MLSSVTLEDKISQPQYPASYSAYAEEASAIPWLKYPSIQQLQKVSSYSSTDSEDAVIRMFVPKNHVKFEIFTKVELIARARQTVRDDYRDLDPDIKQLVNDNFTDLVWK